MSFRRYDTSGNDDGQDFVQRTMATRITPVTKALIIANVAVFAAQCALMLATRSRVLSYWLGLSPWLVFRRGYLWQLITYAFLHAGIIHIIFNMLFLYWFGREVEMRLGARRYLWFYMGAALAGAVVFSVVYAVAGKWERAAVGASAAVMGVMVVYAVYWPNRVIYFFGLFPMKVRTFVLMAIAIDLYNEVFSGGAGVAGLAHLGGAAYGYIYVKAYPRWLDLRDRVTDARLRRERSQSLSDNEILDQILEKVHDHGMHTLTNSEKRFLTRISERKRR